MPRGLGVRGFKNFFEILYSNVQINTHGNNCFLKKIPVIMIMDKLCTYPQLKKTSHTIKTEFNKSFHLKSKYNILTITIFYTVSQN